MNIQITNLRYADPDNIRIDMDVTGWIAGEAIPFTYHPADRAPLSLVVRAMLAAGEQPIAAYTAPAGATL